MKIFFKEFRRLQIVFTKKLLLFFLIIFILSTIIIRLHCLSDSGYGSKLKEEAYKYSQFSIKECKLYTYNERSDLMTSQPFILNNLPVPKIGNIPKIIHTTWKKYKIPPAWNKPYWDCVKKNSDFVFCHWTDLELAKLVVTFFRNFSDIYFSYRHPIQRVDVTKYFLLKKYGGFYKDLDIGCLKSFAKLVNNSTEVVLIEAEPLGVVGDFFGASANNPFFTRVTNNLYWWPTFFIFPYLDVMIGTGPTFLSLHYYFYSKYAAIQVLPNKLYVDDFFEHYQGSTWHCLDGKIIWYLYTHLFTTLAICLIFLSVLYKLMKFY